MLAPRVLPLSILFAILALAGTAPSSLAQEGPVLGQDTSISIQGGVLWPDEFGDLQPPVFDASRRRTITAANSRFFLDGEPGPILAVRVAFPLRTGLAIEAAWDFAHFGTVQAEERNGTVREEDPELSSDYLLHVYGVQVRHSFFRDGLVRPHVSAFLGGFTTILQRRGVEDAQATDPASGVGVGLLVPLHSRFGLRFDARDVIQFCGGGRGSPCAEEGARHHVTMTVGMETAF